MTGGELARFRRPYRSALHTALLLTIAQALLDIARPWPLKIAIDNGLMHRPSPGWLAGLHGLSPPWLAAVTAGAAVLLAVGAAASGYVATMLVGVAAERIGADIRNTLIARLFTFPLCFHDRHRSTELVARLTTDVGRTEESLVVWFEGVIPAAIELAGMLTVLFLIDPLLAVVALMATPVLVLAGARRRRSVRGAHAAARAAQGHLAARAADLLRGVRVVQAFDQSARAQHEFALANRATTRAEVEALTTEQRLAPAADLLVAIGAGAVLFAGVVRVAAGTVTLGTLLVVLSYVASLYGPARAMSRLSSTLGRGAASRARLLELLQDDGPAPTPGNQAAPRLAHSFTFEDVWFAYEREDPILRGVQLTVPAGATVCLMGASGAGKSTLLNLVLRLYDPGAGKITIDGVDLRDCSVNSVRRHMALVPQDPWLLEGTIRDNIAFGRPAVTDLEIRLAARAALVDGFIRDLADGYDTLVGEGGVRLSGGQRRRLAIARAIVRDTDLLLLDEPTSDLDTASAAAVTEALSRAFSGRTTLLVTHDPALASLADRVVVLEGGRIKDGRRLVEKYTSARPPEGPMASRVTAIDAIRERR